MRNLKKVLSLALAMVMLLGMMVVGAGAASFTDDADITHKEAVAVVSGIEVLLGVDDGSKFDPKGTLTRAQAAVVIAKLDLGAAFGNLATTNASTFKDVGDGYGWAKPYIDYCAARGLIVGDDNGYYHPANDVTGIEFALMVSRVLGYEDANESISGPSWQVNAAAVARKAGLTVDVTLGSEAISRDDMAQVAFNALKADMVEYDGRAITIGDVVIPAGKAQAVAGTSTTNGAKDYRDGATDDATQQLCEAKFAGLKLKAGEDDVFGRPGDRKWEYNDDSIYNVVKTAKVTHNAKTSAASVLKELKGLTYNDKKISTEDDVNAIAAMTENGKLVEIFVTDKTVDTIVQIEYSVGEVTNVTTNKDGDVTYTVTKESGNIASRSGKVYADSSKGDTAVLAGEVEKGDIVTFTVKNNTLYIYPTTSFDGTQTSRNTAKQTITVDGETYTVATGLGLNSTSFENSSNTATFYLDQFGYVVKSTVIEDAGDYAVVDEIRYVNNGGIGTSKSVEARLVFADGSSDIVTVTKINGVKASAITDANGAIDLSDTTNPSVKVSSTIGNNTALMGKVVKYSESDGNYAITYTLNGNKTPVGNSGTSSKNTTVVEKGVPSFVFNGTTKATANKDTVYIVKTDSAKYSVYTGYQNVVTVKAGATAGIGVSYSEKSGKVNMVYVDATATGADVGETTNEIVYILNKNAYSQTGSGSDKKWTYTEAVLNGVEGEVVSSVSFEANGFYEVKLNEDGEVTEIVKTNDVPASTAWLKSSVTATSDDADQIVINGKGYVCSDAKVYVVDDTFYEGDGTNAAIGDTVYIKTKGNASSAATKADITAEIVYIVKDSSSATVPGSVGASEIEKLFNEQDKDEVTVTGAITGAVAVPEGKKLIVNAKPTGTVTLAKGATLKLSAAMELPKVEGAGTVEIPSDVMIETPTGTDYFADLEAKVTIVEKRVTMETPATGETKSAEIAITAGTKFTGNGMVESYDSLHTMDEISAVTGGKAGVPVSLHKITIPKELCDAGNVIKVYYTTSTGTTKTYTQIKQYTSPANTDAHIFGSGDGKTVPSGWNTEDVSVILPLADTVTGIKVDVSKPGGAG